MISNRYLSKTAYGKKPLILSCDAATLGVHGLDNKSCRPKNVIKLSSKPHFLRCRGRLWYVAAMQFTSTNQRPVHIYGTRNKQTSKDATDFLRANDRMAALLPTAMRMASLQRDCQAALPPMFGNCDVLSFQDGTLVLAVPTSAVAAKLKQQAPKLQATLQKKGWQIDSVKIKIQVGRALPPQQEMLKPSSFELPPTAVQAFEELGDALPESPQNAPLIAAIRRLAEKRKQK